MGELTDDFIFGDRAGDSDWSDGGASPSFVDGVRQGPSGPLPEGSGIIHTRHHSEIYRKTNAVLASQEGTNVAATGVLYEKLSEQNVGRRNDHRNAGMRSSIVTLMNSCLGASLLVLPFGTHGRAVSGFWVGEPLHPESVVTQTPLVAVLAQCVPRPVLLCSSSL